MEVWMILHKLRDDGRLRNRENDLKELSEIVNLLSRASPFVGRIVKIVKENNEDDDSDENDKKFYAGKIEKLKLNGEQLEFTIADSDKNGETDGNSKIHQGKIPLENLEDIQTWYKNGKPLSLVDLLNDHKMEEKND